MATLRGKVPPELRNDEDLLTSTIFGLLQYVPISPFWLKLLREAKNVRGEDFYDHCERIGHRLDDAVEMAIHFWPFHAILGEPDLLCVFRTLVTPPLCFIIETKLWSDKSGEGEEDQLNRYLQLLGDREWLSSVTRIGEMSPAGVIYLTPRAAWSDVVDSIATARDPLDSESSIFLLQWQDIIEVARKIQNELSAPFDMILRDVTHFLERRGLKRFNGFIEYEIDRGLAPPRSSGNFRFRAFRGFPSSPYPPGRKTTKETSYGKRIGIALKAIAALHVEVGQLFTDCDALFRRYKSLYGNNGTRDLSRAIRGGPWMAEAVYRFWYKGDAGHGVRSVPGVTAIFCSKEDPERLDQPVLIAGIVDYEPMGMDHVLNYDPWHLWHMWMTWNRAPSFDSVLNLAEPDEGVRHIRAIGVPLVQIESVDDIEKLFRKIGFGATD